MLAHPPQKKKNYVYAVLSSSFNHQFVGESYESPRKLFCTSSLLRSSASSLRISFSKPQRDRDVFLGDLSWINMDRCWVFCQSQNHQLSQERLNWMAWATKKLTYNKQGIGKHSIETLDFLSRQNGSWEDIRSDKIHKKSHVASLGIFLMVMISQISKYTPIAQLVKRMVPSGEINLDKPHFPTTLKRILKLMSNFELTNIFIVDSHHPLVRFNRSKKLNGFQPSHCAEMKKMWPKTTTGQLLFILPR